MEIIMYCTAMYAFKIGRKDLVVKFNEGNHVIDNNNEQNSYSIVI